MNSIANFFTRIVSRYMPDPLVVAMLLTALTVIFAMLIAIPFGIWLGRRPRAESLISPFLDALQTIPNLVYAIPFVMIFSVGPVPGIVAAVVYAIPPGIRLTSLGIRQVNYESLEAATTFGATPRQVLWGVRVPLAMPSIILAINQMVMMVLAMAIIAGMVGGGGLGVGVGLAVVAEQPLAAAGWPLADVDTESPTDSA